jgi:hypothetical protein
MKRLALLFLLGFSTQALAVNAGGLFIEPMITYQKGEGDLKFPAPLRNSDVDLQGFGVGARLGFHILESIFIGADGRYSMLKYEDNGLNQDTDAKGWNVAPVAGLQMPTLLGLRVWGGYVLMGELDPDKNRNVDLRFKKPRGLRLGAGIKLGPTSLNLEYEKLKYDETAVDEAGVFTPGYTSSDVELDTTAWILSVSFPISI